MHSSFFQPKIQRSNQQLSTWNAQGDMAEPS